MLSTPVTTPHRKRIAELAIKHRLPILSPRATCGRGRFDELRHELRRSDQRHSQQSTLARYAQEPSPLTCQWNEYGVIELVINLKAARELGIHNASLSPQQRQPGARIGREVRSLGNTTLERGSPSDILNRDDRSFLLSSP